ncbi:MAG: DUF11 domain-containing protein, partial [Candidatus Schekmanbacteria bacterium]|nr:DUF11 domain-containing protein [Candidatus Schekmanbacteria bacterium]
LDPDGSRVERATFLGGSQLDQCTAIAVTAAGEIAVAGITQSDDFPVKDAYQGTAAGGSQDVFVSVFDATLSSLRFSTYLGGTSPNEQTTSIAAASTGDVVVVGWGAGSDFPTLGSLIDFSTWSLFAARFSSGGGLLYSTALATSTSSWGQEVTAVAVTGGGDALVAGYTEQPGFPTTADGIQPVAMGERDGFLVRLAPAADLTVAVTEDVDPVLANGPLRYSLTAENLGEAEATGVTLSAVLPAGATFGSATPSQGDCTGTAPLTCALGALPLGASATVALALAAPPEAGTATIEVSITADQPDQRPASNAATLDTAVALAGISLEPAAMTTWESQGTIKLFVRLHTGDGQPSAAEVSAFLTTGDGTAYAVQDYGPTAGSWVFPAGSQDGAVVEQLYVSIVDDGAIEGPETFTVTMSDPSAGAALSGPRVATVTIMDSAPVVPAASIAALAAALMVWAGAAACRGRSHRP